MSTIELQPDSFEINVVCDNCGRGVEATLWQGEIIVAPCEYCLDKAREEE